MTLALADGSWIFIAIWVGCCLAIVFSYYTRRGSAINQHPHRNVYSSSPGAKTPSVISHDRSAADRVVDRPRSQRGRRRSAEDHARQPRTTTHDSEPRSKYN